MRGDGRIYRRPATRHWWVEYHANGVRHRESSGTDNKQEARRFLRKRQQDAAEGKKPWAKLKVEDLLRMVSDDYAVNNRKMDLRGPFKHLALTLGVRPAASISSDTITTYSRNRLDSGAAPATVNIELAVLRRGFNLALEAEKISHMPKIKALRVNNARKGFFERADLDAVLKHLPVELRYLMKTAYLTGWRIGELMSRQRKHVDLEAGFLRLDPGESKNGEGRMFPLTPELRTLLEAQLAWTRGIEVSLGRVIPWLFHRQGHRILSYKHAWAVATKAAGLSDRLVHDFRRSAVRNMERSGVSRAAAMLMVGHRTSSMYSRYAIVDEAMLHEAADKLSRIR